MSSLKQGFDLNPRFSLYGLVRIRIFNKPGSDYVKASKLYVTEYQSQEEYLLYGLAPSEVILLSRQMVGVPTIFNRIIRHWGFSIFLSCHTYKVTHYIEWVKTSGIYSMNLKYSNSFYLIPFSWFGNPAGGDVFSLHHLTAREHHLYRNHTCQNTALPTNHPLPISGNHLVTVAGPIHDIQSVPKFTAKLYCIC